MEEENGYNPLDKVNLGKSVVAALLQSEELPLGGVESFPGAGIYALYYSGSFAPYCRLSERNSQGGEYPVYVGKAVPTGGRKGVRRRNAARTRALWKRLQDHRASIEAVDSLRLEDFSYRKLVVDDIWIPLGESLVIERFHPLWNIVVEGFGNHNPGSGRFLGKRPLWDELHPGRSWAEKCGATKYSREEILEQVRLYFERMGAA